MEVQYRFWARIRAGDGREVAASAVGVSLRTGERWFAERGGLMPPASASHRARVLSIHEREEIALQRAQRRAVREIARVIGRSPSTVSRELRRLPRNPNDRHRPVYRAGLHRPGACRCVGPRGRNLPGWPRIWPCAAS
ncbi:hypothetical protein GCM10011331_22480 [Flavimobilis marinus]|nr:hypothetical protein GCM10011331_22480 [Flavimobilis marinus]